MVHIQVVFLLNMGNHEETQSHEHHQGPHDLQGQKPTDLGLRLSSVCLIHGFLFPGRTASWHPDAQDADEHATGQEQKPKDKALGKLAALPTEEGPVRVLLDASPPPLLELKPSTRAGQDHSPEAHHGTCGTSHLQHHTAVWEVLVVAGLVPKDGQQDPHTQQDGSKDEEEENELADTAILLVFIQLSSSSSSRRHGQRRPAQMGPASFPPLVSIALVQILVQQVRSAPREPRADLGGALLADLGPARGLGSSRPVRTALSTCASARGGRASAVFTEGGGPGGARRAGQTGGIWPPPGAVLRRPGVRPAREWAARGSLGAQGWAASSAATAARAPQE